MLKKKINLLTCLSLLLAFPLASYAQTGAADDRLKKL